MPPLATPADDLALLSRAAREAGDIARRFWRQEPRAWDKDGGAGPVTEADLAVNIHLQQMLGAARPSYGWLSEETPDEPARLDAARTFVVDPIDGTRAFIDGQEGFSHALAVVEGDQVIAGVVYLPIPDLMYAARAGGPATLNGAVIAPSAATAPDGASVLTGKASFAPVHWRGGLPPEMRRMFRPSIAWRMCLVAEGQFDAVMALRASWEWDIAAGSLIAERAGCVVSDRRGRALRFNQPQPLADGLLLAPPALHAALLARLVPNAGED
ncbi:3'(2'),5'-bisphosphate nucleotidase CysQ [Paracoccus suum]|uniref:3'(2'),5'-bisphosphate nucleotidase CysQ n=1 Tax=Paracoccus suum TaxID=2259340 RepID=A0A344PHN6_9RHOB|nr:3'(2'),5'-bisphosphate nucleotidase CysQ [Paracoccus suum]AXC48891.1 3'(2'),5'-bisphosphate nucleotidase CysQ [Paracoccus suum]